MTDVNCPVCEDVLEQVEPGTDGLFNDDDDITKSFVVRKFMCNNVICPLHEKRLDVFFDYVRIVVDGDDIDIDALTNEFIEEGRES